MINQVIYSRLATDSTISSYITESGIARVYLERWPIEEKTFPKIVYSVTNRNVVSSYTGKSGLASYSVEVSVLSETPDGCAALNGAVRELFEDTSWGDDYLPAVQGSFLEDEDLTPQQTILGDDWTVWEMTSSYTVWVEDKRLFEAVSAEYVYGSGESSGSVDAVLVTYDAVEYRLTFDSDNGWWQAAYGGSLIVFNETSDLSGQNDAAIEIWSTPEIQTSTIGSITYDNWVVQGVTGSAISAATISHASTTGMLITFNMDIDPTSLIATTCEIQTSDGGAFSGGAVDTAALDGSSVRVVSVTSDSDLPIYGVRWTNLSQSFTVPGAVFPESIVVAI